MENSQASQTFVKTFNDQTHKTKWPSFQKAFDIIDFDYVRDSLVKDYSNGVIVRIQSDKRMKRSFFEKGEHDERI